MNGPVRERGGEPDAAGGLPHPLKGSETLFEVVPESAAPHFVTLREPLFDIGPSPDAACRNLPEGLREADLARELVGTLTAQVERLRDLGDAHEFHERQFTRPLDNVKSHWHSDLDTVKGGTP